MNVDQHTQDTCVITQVLPLGRVQKIAALVADGLSMAEVGRRLGISREYVRTICHRWGIRPVPVVKPVAFPLRNFHFRMRRHLFDAGYLQCPRCGDVKPVNEWSPKSRKQGIYCRHCSSTRMNAQYHANAKIRAYQKQYIKAHPEYYRRWSQEHPERRHEITSRHYQKLKSTEEGREKLREYRRRSYQNAMSTEEGRAKRAQKASAQYLRRKASKGEA